MTEHRTSLREIVDRLAAQLGWMICDAEDPPFYTCLGRNLIVSRNPDGYAKKAALYAADGRLLCSRKWWGKPGTLDYWIAIMLVMWRIEFAAQPTPLAEAVEQR